MTLSIHALSWQAWETATEQKKKKNTLQLRHSLNVIATISGMLCVKHNRTSTDDDSYDQKRQITHVC